MFAIILGYLIGSLPFSYIVPKLVKNVDIRTVGSGNVGATNVSRCCGFIWAFIAFLGDASKGAVAFYIANQLWGFEAALLAAMAVLIGHCYSFILGFDGGKGVATFAGTLIILAPELFFIFAFVLLGLLFISKVMSLSGLTSLALLSIFAMKLDKPSTLILYLLVSGLFIIFQHRSNIARILAGEEKKLNLTLKK